MKRAIRTFEVSRKLWNDPEMWPDPVVMLPQPFDPVYVTGPRGGRYLAVGPWTRHVDEGTGFVMNLVTVVDVSAGLRYIRPKRK